MPLPLESKACDCVNHAKLLKIWYNSEIYGIVNKLIKSSFMNWKQCVFYDNKFSKETEVKVPQGSVLGPFLFLLYVSDFADNIVTLLNKHMKLLHINMF